MHQRQLNKIFQSRTDRKVTFATPPPGTLGAVQVNPTTGETLAGFIPLENAYGRTVRLHEADHLRYGTPPDHKRRFITEARKATITEDCAFQLINGLEDMFISSLPVWYRRPLSVRRDARATALRELRDASRRHRHTKVIGNPDVPLSIQDTAKASLLNLLLRCVALEATTHDLSQPNPQTRALSLIYSVCGLIPPDPIHSALLNLLNYVVAKEFAQARRELIELGKPFERPAIPIPECKVDDTDPDYEQLDRDHDYSAGACVRDGDVPVKLVNPPRTAPCVAGEEVSDHDEHASTGYSIRRSCLTQLAIGIPISRPFIRRQSPTPAGVIIIDASGSMHIDADKLRALCRVAPAATVAYYSGEDDYGYIVIYAKDGSRLDDAIELPNLNDGNVADEQALLFGLAERKRLGSDQPVTLISDLGFNGNSDASENRALDIVRSGTISGTLRVITSFSEALTAFTHAAQFTQQDS